MSASAQNSSQTSKALASDSKNGDAAKDAQKPAAQLEEDDEFEDFPVEGNPSLAVQFKLGASRMNTYCAMSDWPEEETQLPGGNAHLWEESWDDDDTNEDFAVQLREELKKLGQK
ncbi:uncharacterized protein BDR25DRAFT_347379 [Lindgomyces ingoldianus]|uniref:Uncharacterized protein n=1 Tax=Lindgomyces ingoldianus TaxID=673940 RepID=A0ACB6QAI7_9PLEO|nr:uncharacterized protein BDR25DRAFT_347379 [Lindgomyces ingoldianus]KAF2463161.1 hypothetical protein BDR25DRAFT_347379 [Lindgomyces ingoldianus]